MYRLICHGQETTSATSEKAVSQIKYGTIIKPPLSASDRHVPIATKSDRVMFMTAQGNVSRWVSSGSVSPGFMYVIQAHPENITAIAATATHLANIVRVFMSLLLSIYAACDVKRRKSFGANTIQPTAADPMDASRTAPAAQPFTAATTPAIAHINDFIIFRYFLNPVNPVFHNPPCETSQGQYRFETQ